MKRAQPLSLLALGAILILVVEISRAANAVVQQRFAIEEYELFHKVLDPLQHEALPQGDFQRIRSVANELVESGKAIVKLRLPKAEGENRRRFAETRRKFDRALDAFMSDARKNNNPRLGKSLTAVHDSFEELADLAPTVYSPHLPTVSLSCSCSNPEPGRPLILTASATPPFDARKRSFVWILSGGKIVNGQGTPILTIDTTGQAGQKILVTVEVDDGDGHLMRTSYETQIAASKQS